MPSVRLTLRQALGEEIYFPCCRFIGFSPPPDSSVPTCRGFRMTIRIRSRVSICSKTVVQQQTHQNNPPFSLIIIVKYVYYDIILVKVFDKSRGCVNGNHSGNRYRGESVCASIRATTTWKRFSDDPVGMAMNWQSLGAMRLHIVDLDEGLPAN